MKRRRIAFSREAGRAVQEALRALNRSRGGRVPYSLHRLLDNREAFVRAVEAGYDDCIYEYQNDLVVRDFLEEILQAVDPAARGPLAAIVEPIDRRFEAATRFSPRPVLPGLDREPDGWWPRAPNVLPAELADDLRADGLVA